MDYDAYTSDAICESLGLGPFVSPTWKPRTLRVLLKPSFNPEVCITVAEQDCLLSVVAGADMVWRQSAPCAIGTYSDECTVESGVAEKLFSNFNLAVLAHQDPNGRFVVFDGMAIHGHLCASDRCIEFEDHPYRPSSRNFVTQLIDVAWKSLQDAGTKNALADCGGYVSMRLPKSQLEPQAPLFRIAMVGTPDAVAELSAEIEREPNSKGE